MARSGAKRIAIVCVVVGFGFQATARLANAQGHSADVAKLESRCTQGRSDSCQKVLKALEHCKSDDGCAPLLHRFSDSQIIEIATDQNIIPVVRQEADQIKIRRAGFHNLSKGMNVDEVEAAIGPINPNFAEMLRSASAAGNLEVTSGGQTKILVKATDNGVKEEWQQGDPRMSSFYFDGVEFELYFDYLGQLDAFHILSPRY